MFRPLDWLLSRFSIDMGIDLGTANTLVCVRGGRILLNEPSIVAVYKGSNRVIANGQAVGKNAEELAGRTSDDIDVVRPMVEGVIADFEITEQMLRYFIRKVQGGRGMVKPRVVIAVPWGINPVEKRAVIGSAEAAGARKVFLINEPTAAAIGADLPIHEPRGHMIVDIGGGTSEIAVLSLASVVRGECVKIAGDDFNEAIRDHVRLKYNLHIGPITTERLKKFCGSALPLEEDVEVEVKGQDCLTGLPRSTVISSAEIRLALQEPLKKIISAIRKVLERTPPELSADIVSTGITVCGGGSMLRGLPQMIASETDLPTRVAEDPLDAVARGTGMFLENLDFYQQFLQASDDLGS